MNELETHQETKNKIMNTIVSNNNLLPMSSVNSLKSSTNLIGSLCLDTINDDSLLLIQESQETPLGICMFDNHSNDYDDDYDEREEYDSGYEWTDEDAWDAMTDGMYGDYPGSGWDPEMFGY